MAPREASGTFPDQYLTYDYEASVPLGAPTVHEAFPAAAVDVDANIDEGPPRPVTNLNVNVNVNVNVANHNHNPNANPASAARCGGGGAATAAAVVGVNHTPVDPLSIDPTAAATATATALSSPQLPDLSLNSVRTMRNTQVASALMRPSNLRPSILFAHQTSTASASASSVPGMTAATDSSSMNSSPVAVTPHHQHHHHHHHQHHVSLLVDDVPGLDVTYDSASTSMMMVMNQSSDSWENAHMVEDDQSFSAGSSPVASSVVSTTSSSQGTAPSSPSIVAPSPVPHQGPPSSPTSIALSFGPNTTVADLKYFAERGCIVALLQALTTPRLVTLGTRMLADYAKMSHRRVAVASNRRILEFIQQTMLHVSPSEEQQQLLLFQQQHQQQPQQQQQQQLQQQQLQDPTNSLSEWLGREYAVETIRSLTLRKRVMDISWDPMDS